MKDLKSFTMTLNRQEYRVLTEDSWHYDSLHFLWERSDVIDESPDDIGRLKPSVIVTTLLANDAATFIKLVGNERYRMGQTIAAKINQLIDDIEWDDDFREREGY